MSHQSRHSLRPLLALALSICVTQTARAADPNPAPKTDSAVAADDQSGPGLQVRVRDNGPSGPTIAVAGSDSSRSVSAIAVAPGAPGFSLPGLPTPPDMQGVPPGTKVFFVQRQVGDGLPTPTHGPDGPQMIIRVPDQIGQFPPKMITSGPTPNAMGFPLPDGKMIATVRGGNRIWVNDPDMQRLMEQDAMFDHQSQEMAEEYRRAPKDKQGEVKKKLEEVVSHQFDSRQERRSLELKQLEDQIKQIKTSIDKRNAAKKQIVDRRVSEVLGQDDTSF